MLTQTGRHRKKKSITRSHAIVTESLEEGEVISKNDQSHDELNSTDVIQEAKNPPKLPAETPDWGIKLLEIIQNEFKNVTSQIGQVEKGTNKNSKDIKSVERRL